MEVIGRTIFILEITELQQQVLKDIINWPIDHTFSLLGKAIFGASYLVFNYLLADQVAYKLGLFKLCDILVTILSNQLLSVTSSVNLRSVTTVTMTAIKTSTRFPLYCLLIYIRPRFTIGTKKNGVFKKKKKKLYIYTFNNYCSSPNGFWVNSPWGRRPNRLLTQRPWGREE